MLASSHSSPASTMPLPHMAPPLLLELMLLELIMLLELAPPPPLLLFVAKLDDELLDDDSLDVPPAPPPPVVSVPQAAHTMPMIDAINPSFVRRTMLMGAIYLL